MILEPLLFIYIMSCYTAHEDDKYGRKSAYYQSECTVNICRNRGEVRCVSGKYFVPLCSRSERDHTTKHYSKYCYNDKTNPSIWNEK